MPTRSRSRSTVSPSIGKCIFNGTLIVEEPLTSLSEACTDMVEPGNGHPLTIERFYIDKPGNFPISRGTFNYFGNVEFQDFPIRNLCNASWNINHAPIDGAIPTIEQAAAKVAADTNPSRPHVDIPVALGELRNLKDLFVKRVGRIGRDIASGRLALEYGYKPLINDLIRLTSLGDAYAARLRELSHLRRTGLRRKRIAFKGTGVSKQLGFPLQNLLGSVVHGDLNSVTTLDCTVFIRWGYQPLLEIQGINTGSSIHAQAASAILGWTPTLIDASTLWELMGFSWYFDWWTNAGDLLAANRNSTGAFPEKIQVMYHTKTEQVANWHTAGSSYDAKWSTKSPVVRYHETKTRTPASLSFQAHLPILSNKQMTILADIMRGFG